MNLIALHLVWKRDGEDVEVGVGFHEVLPPAGSLLVHPSEHGAVWRVRFLYFHLIQRGSKAHMTAQDGRRCDEPTVYLFVEPAEGPYEP